MKFIHCADVHLDTPLQGLAQYAGAPAAEIRNATRRAFEKVLDTALAEKVDFVIIAGDLYDTGLKSFESALFFNRHMSRLKEAGINLYLIYGNHDAASKLIKQLRPPRNVHVLAMWHASVEQPLTPRKPVRERDRSNDGTRKPVLNGVVSNSQHGSPLRCTRGRFSQDSEHYQMR
jgi:DNA repair exonuclease SbcCD nuclease subunit